MTKESQNNLVASMPTNFEIELPQFKGPFDLLLFFIQRDELNIYDIPIHKITTDFLDYIHHMQQLNMELASEFILVAASLMKIKAQMLLPRKVLDEEGNEIDPRHELVQKILEYKQYKEICKTLEVLEAARMQKIGRMGAKKELEYISKLYQTDLEMEDVTLAKLLKVFESLLQKKRQKEAVYHHEINFVPFNIEDEKNHIVSKLTENRKIDFRLLFEVVQTKIHAIYLFLAMLELIQEEKINIIFGEGLNNFWIISNET